MDIKKPFFAFCGVLLIGGFIFAEIKDKSIKGISIPKKVILDNKVLVDKVEVLSEIPPIYKITLKNNDSKSVSIGKYRVKVVHFRKSNGGEGAWIPHLLLVKPSLSAEFAPGQSIELVYKASDDKAIILDQMDYGILVYDELNDIEVNVFIEGEEGNEKSRFSYEGNFLWKPEIADLRIRSAEVKLLSYELPPLERVKLKCSVLIENIGSASPFLKRKDIKSLDLVKVKMIRKKDGKIFVLNMKPYGKFSINEFINKLSPGQQTELEFISDSSLSAFEIIGDFDITIGLDEPVIENNNIYLHFLGDANVTNNLLIKTETFGTNLFEAVSFYPKKISVLRPAVAKEFRRLESDLMYVEIKSYAPLSKIDDINDIGVYFGDERLRIFSIKFENDNYKIWVEKPKKAGEGNIRVNIFDISRTFKANLVASSKLEMVSDSKFAEWPFYFDSSPEYTFYFGTKDPVPPYGSKPLFIDGVNIRGSLSMSILVGLKSEKLTWLESSKSVRDIPRAKLEDYGTIYKLRVYVRPANKIQWRFLDSITSPVTIEPDKRAVVKLDLSEEEAVKNGMVTTDDKEFLFLLSYIFKVSEDGKLLEYEVLSDMYWTRIKQ